MPASSTLFRAGPRAEHSRRGRRPYSLVFRLRYHMHLYSHEFYNEPSYSYKIICEDGPNQWIYSTGTNAA